jgi:hypothetical protein
MFSNAKRNALLTCLIVVGGRELADVVRLVTRNYAREDKKSSRQKKRGRRGSHLTVVLTTERCV